MSPLVLLGAGVGLGLTMVAYGLRPPRPSLAAAIDAVRRPPPAPMPTWQRLVHTLGWPLGRLGFGRKSLARDLAIMGRDPTRYLAGQLALAVLGLLTPPAAVAGLGLVGVPVGWVVPLWAGLLLAFGAIVIARLDLHEAAEARRLQVRHTLAALLDLVPSALAAGAGIQQALTDACAIASGWAAQRIRDALETARVTRAPLWQPLRHLGQAIGVGQLEQLAATLQLAAQEGTRIREALLERGDAIAERLTADLEARAASATERMAIPLMALTMIFVLFLVYPAIAALFPTPQ